MKVTMRGVAQCIVLFTAIALVMPPIHSPPPEEPAPWSPFIEGLGWGVLLDILVIQWFRPRHRAYALVEAVMYGMFTALVVVFAASAAWNMIVFGEWTGARFGLHGHFRGHRGFCSAAPDGCVAAGDAELKRK